LLPNITAKYVPLDENEQTITKSGELWVKGPNIFRGYLNNPVATRDAFSKDGYFKTGDIGFEDNEGQFFITDRVKELIKYKGFQVAPAELEAILLTHPVVADAAVIGSPSGHDGTELPRAYVVLAENGIPESQTSKDITDFVSGKVASHKRLRGGVQFVKAIPRNPAGKILRRELRQALVKAAGLRAKL
jgi:4-coumarate--CoA ligase